MTSMSDVITLRNTFVHTRILRLIEIKFSNTHAALPYSLHTYAKMQNIHLFLHIKLKILKYVLNIFKKIVGL